MVGFRHLKTLTMDKLEVQVQVQVKEVQREDYNNLEVNPHR